MENQRKSAPQKFPPICFQTAQKAKPFFSALIQLISFFLTQCHFHPVYNAAFDSIACNQNAAGTFLGAQDLKFSSVVQNVCFLRNIVISNLSVIFFLVNQNPVLTRPSFAIVCEAQLHVS